MTTLHFVTHSVYPTPGGMYESVLRIAKGFTRGGSEAVIYTLGQPAAYREACREHDGVSVVHLGEDNALILQPFIAAARPSAALEGEQSRVNLLRLTNAISQRVESHPGERHLIVSFYASGSGFFAQHVASGLRLPHIAAVRGTDFACDLVSLRGHPRVRFVIEKATQVVTTNRRQADTLSAMFDVQRPIRTIHNSIPDVDARPFWKPFESDVTRLVSDCGFSGRKGTHLLLRAVEALVEKQLPLSLTIVGGTYALDDSGYWDELKQSYQTRYPGRFHFPGQLPREEIDDYLRAAHIYCSATLAEGCSLSRIRALTIGIPIVTTRCGALPELAAGCDHVRLSPPGDWPALARELEAAVTEIRANHSSPDSERIEGWRKHFSVDRERKEWLAAIEAACK
jgi:glycosyltransferase involved in cell wall biosynthesis